MPATHLFSACTVIFCAVAVWQVFEIPSPPSYSAVGPSVFPAVIVGLFSFASLIFIGNTSRGTHADSAQVNPPKAQSTRRVAYFLIGALAFIAGIQWLGFLVPATICGMLIGAAFESPFNKKSFAITFTTSLVVWVVFSLFLKVNLGPLLHIGLLNLKI